MDSFNDFFWIGAFMAVKVLVPYCLFFLVAKIINQSIG